MNKIIRLWPVAALILLASCSKKEKEVVVVDSQSIINSEIVEQVNSNRNMTPQVSSRISLKLEAGAKKLNVGGTLKMQRDDVIQISLQVFGLVEAGRLEMTQDYILILNRLGKQYVKASYADIPFFRDNGINFFTFQALLWNELFTPNSMGNTPKLMDYAQQQEGENLILTHTTPTLVTKFLTHAATHLLKQTDLAGANGCMKWTYNSWARLNGKDFPDKMGMDMNFKNASVKAEMALSRLHMEEKWKETRTAIDKKKMKEVPIQVAFKQILSLSE